MNMINTAEQFLTTFCEAIKEILNNVNPDAQMLFFRFMNI